MVESVLGIRASACQTYLPSRLASPTVWGPRSRVVSRALIMRDLPLGCSTCRCVLMRDRMYMYVRTHTRTPMCIKARLPIHIHRSPVPTRIHICIHINPRLFNQCALICACIHSYTFLPICTRAHTNICTCTRTCACTHRYIPAYPCLYTFLHTHTYAPTSTHSNIHIHVHTPIPILVYVHVNIRIYMCVYIYIHTSSRSRTCSVEGHVSVYSCGIYIRDLPLWEVLDN
jgi:hypothetical protein